MANGFGMESTVRSQLSPTDSAGRYGALNGIILLYERTPMNKFIIFNFTAQSLKTELSTFFGLQT